MGRMGRLTALYLLWAGLGAPPLHAEERALDRMALWAPQTVDAYTLCLYHLDEAVPESERPQAEAKSTVPEPTLADPGALLDAVGGDPMVIAAEEQGNKAQNAVPMRAGFTPRGDFAFVTEGRFGGGLRLQSGNSGVSGEFVTGNPHDGQDRTIAFWFKPERMPTEKATVFTYFAMRKPPAGYEPMTDEVSVTLLPDGSLRIHMAEVGDTVVPQAAALDQWCHVALSWGGVLTGKRSYAHVNGNLVLDKRNVPRLGWLLDTWRVGSDSRRANGLIGVIDEVYMSKDVKLCYRVDLDWVDRDGTLARAIDRPFFRDPADETLRLDFNRSFTPTRQPAGITAAPLPEPSATNPDTILQATDAEDTLRYWFPLGVEKSGLRLAREVPMPRLEGPGLLPAEEGTLAFWFKPINWDNFDKWHEFMGFGQPWAELLRVSRGDEPVLRFRLAGRVNNAVSNPLEIAPGAWMHVAICWRGESTWTYVNGRRDSGYGTMSISRTPWSAEQPLTLTFLKHETYTCAVDDLHVFSRPLAPSELQNLVRLHRRDQELEALPPFDATTNWNGVTGRVSARLTPLMADYGQLARGELRVYAAGASTPLAAAQADFTPGQELTLRTESEPFDFGTYRIEVDGQDATGKRLGQFVETFERPVPPWWENTLGITDKAPPDWSAIQVIDGATLRVDRRDIHLAGSGLPRQIEADGQPILAGPVAIETPGPLRPAAAVEVLSASEVRVHTRGRLDADEYSIATECEAEYDGFMWFTVTLTPTAGRQPTLDSLRLRVPYRADSADLYHWWTGMHGFRDRRVVRIGELPAEPGVLFQSTQEGLVHPPRMVGNFMPYVLLTGNLRGMAWFAENDQGWTPNDKPALVIERQGEQVHLLLNIISEPVVLDGPRTLRFGLQPLPLKKLNPGWRMTPWWGVIPDSFFGNNLKGDRSTQFDRHPIDFDWSAVQDRIEGRDETSSQRANLLKSTRSHDAAFQRDYGRPPLEHERFVPALYHDLRRFGTFPDMVREWAPGWKGAADSKIYTDSFVDYMTWIWNEWVSRTFIEGVYMDDAFNVPIYDYPSPVTYRLPDGSVQPGFQWRGHREAIKRMRNVLWANGKTPHMCAHITHTPFTPYSAFFDVLLDGEDMYAAPNRKATFIQMWSLPRLRFMNAQKWGLVTTWLDWHGEFNGPVPPEWNYRQGRAFHAAMFLTDLIWARHGYQLHPVLSQEYLIESRYRLDPETRFIPYWDLQGLAEPAHPDIRVSAWRRDGRCLLVIANVGDERVEAAIRIDPAQLGFPGLALADLDRRDVDQRLLAYFDQYKPEQAPSVDANDLLGEGLQLDLEAPETLAERRAKDPDGAFTVADGRLVLPVRPQDFRLIEFLAPGALPKPEAAGAN